MMKKISIINARLIKLLMISVLSSLTLSSISHAVIVFEDQFDEANPVTLDRRLSTANAQQPWVRSQIAFSTTTATISGGFLNVSTDGSPYGGAVTVPRAEFDFFTNELSFTLRGVSLQPATTGGVLNNQGISFGVAPYLSRLNRNNTWHNYSSFSISFYGSGRFELFAANRVLNSTNIRTMLQEIPTPFLNFVVADLTAVRITLDDLNYNVSFEFGNALNFLSLAGPHYLKKDLWGVSSVLRELAIRKTDAETGLATAQASGNAVAIADAQAALDAVIVNYDAQVLIEQEVMGYSALFIGGISADRKGVNASIDSVVVETTNVLGILR